MGGGKRGSRKWQGPMVERCCCYNKILMICLGGSEDEDKRRPREWSNFNFLKFSFQNCLFLGMCLKNLRHSLFGAWSVLLVHIKDHIRFTPREGPKDFVN